MAGVLGCLHYAIYISQNSGENFGGKIVIFTDNIIWLFKLIVRFDFFNMSAIFFSKVALLHLTQAH